MRRRASLILAFGLGLAIVIAACGGGDDDDTDGATSVATGVAGTGSAVVRVAQHPTHGPILVDAQGRTVYRFTQDQKDKSNCDAGCTRTWPAVTTDSTSPQGEGLSGQLTTIQRPDGARQVAYEGMPLYRYTADQAPGEAKGQAVGNIWFVVKPTDKAGGTPAAGGGDYAY